MNAAELTAIVDIRNLLGLRRLDPRRLFLVSDGAYTWIGDRADLTSADANALRAIHSLANRPDRATVHDRAVAEVANYDAICGRVRCIASTCGSGQISMDDLPDSWRDGSALGPIRPLRS